MTFYNLLKLGHVACVVISGSLFIYRYARLSLRPGRPLPKALKVLPHVNDTVLLSCAIGMLILLGLNPFSTPWLLAKIVALLVYIVLGAICMRSLPGSRRQTVSFVAAISVFAYILSVGLSKQLIPL
ncbi:MAG: SirB2 family protein [Proteobacteria bacterium]|nr:SirB2 family protein [Pseudomonadota bacterium]